MLCLFMCPVRCARFSFAGGGPSRAASSSRNHEFRGEATRNASCHDGSSGLFSLLAESSCSYPLPTVASHPCPSHIGPMREGLSLSVTESLRCVSPCKDLANAAGPRLVPTSSAEEGCHAQGRRLSPLDGSSPAPQLYGVRQICFCRAAVPQLAC
jgi:hypothetical protein